ncbi:polymorphic toxin-type HINT domain-containing protein [Paludisphaera borealis]|uniref:Hint domain-containing protein n=1 Tax=Paludisphaera borealis TaxID=1387353 RepID=A0A1U7CJF4_9BACT|nr:polymorphic toxin-type HINT domain-containing protein [Paludisphaera borealis]APW59070.1 hypothetical protein BSF38_00484 [Paludisphaera borealis]
MVSALVLGWALGVAGVSEPEAAKPPGPDMAAYEAAKASAGRDADAHVALALWCEAHGMPAEKATHLARAVLIDPSHAKARGLLGYVKHEGKWLRPEEVSRAVEDSPESQALFREYLGRRTQARDKADDQYKLAKWCEEQGLAQQATAHYHRVLELDPGRDSAWKHLGFKKVSGQWVKPEIVAAQKAEREAQAKADKFWKPKLEKLKDALSGRDKAKKAKAEAEKSLAAIVDPRAVPMVWAVFARGDERWQRVAVGVFSQIEGPVASRALAMTAVFSPVANTRSEASQMLTRRDPRDFARLLVGLLGDEIKFKQKKVAGPGSQGELLVEGKEANVKRLYTPLQAPSLESALMPGDQVGVDQNGMTVVNRLVGDLHFGPRVPLEMFINNPQRATSLVSSLVQNGFPDFAYNPPITYLPTADMTPVFQQWGLTSQQSHELASRLPRVKTATAASGLNISPIVQDSVQIPIGRMAAEAQASAEVAQNQLQQDVRQIEMQNAPIREINDRVSTILKAVSGEDHGADRDKWTEWAYDVEGYGAPLKVAASTPPTVVEPVPLDYQPQAFPVFNSTVLGGARVGPSCFAGGTPVRTLQGARPIEEVKLGDQVLTQDTTTGKLAYQPVVSVFHNPPNVTYRIDLGSESVFPTGIHRFWKAGHGWIMARDVKAGDRLRTIGGTVEVVAASKDRVQPVFNLLLAGGDNYCVGGQGVLAHDNGFVNPVERPFDGVPALADLGATRKP